jgi:hypothetical protein
MAREGLIHLSPHLIMISYDLRKYIIKYAREHNVVDNFAIIIVICEW